MENRGLIPVTSLSVDTLAYMYLKKTDEVPIVGLGHNIPHRIPGKDWIFVPEFNVGDSVQGLPLPAFSEPIGKVQVLLFDLRYFRKSDLEKFTKRCQFFVDDGQLLSDSQFSKKPIYPKVIARVREASVKFTIPDSIKKDAYEWRTE